MTGTSNRRSPRWQVALCLVLAIASPLVHGQANLYAVNGVVLDHRGGLIVQAQVALNRLDGRSEQTSKTNDRGQFHFGRVPAGTYKVAVSKEGFNPVETELTVGATTNAPLRIVLPIGDLHEATAVLDESNQVNARPADNLNIIKLDRSELRKLPVLGNDIIAGLASLLDAGSVGTGGATIVVDGVETDGKRVPASTIQEVRINENPYSAEFARPGRGRIEVITKAGSSEYHGEFNLLFRDYHLDARNAFASTRPEEQRRIYEGNINGPLWGKKTTFLFGIDREEDDLQAIIFAQTPSGSISQNVPYPSRETDINFRLTHQASELTTVSFRYDFSFESADNEGVGGFNLIDVARNNRSRDNELYFSHRRILSPNLIHELVVRFERDREEERSVILGQPKIIVVDAFTGGSGQINRVESEYQMRINQSISWTKGKHLLKAGFNMPDLSRRASIDLSNYGGTFSFSTLNDYNSNRPFLYSINEGEPRLVYWQKEFGLFLQHTMLLRPNLSISTGLRYDWQNYLGDRNNFAPRLSFAYAPGSSRKTVIRGGIGIFYDRTGNDPIADILRFDGQRVREVTITNPGFPDPFSTGGASTAEPVSIVRFSPGVRSPYTIQSSIGIERQLAKSMTVSANYINTISPRLFRSRNVNAPIPPSLEPLDPAVGVLREIESTGRAEGHALEVVLRGRLGRFFNGTAQYTLGRAFNNTGGIDSFPANSYDLRSEWGRANFDDRHRFNLLSTFKAGEWFDIGINLSLTSGRPYSLTTGRDDNGDTFALDRPAGVKRNSLQGPESARLDVRWSKEFEMWKPKKGDGPTLSISIDAFNVLNRVNYSGYVGNLSSPFFGQAVASQPARRLQFSLGFEF